MENILCEMRGVSHDFSLPNGKVLRVLNDINLAIYPREVVALLGPSGCGKSTILRILAGLQKPTAGAVFRHDRPLSGLNPSTAIVFQSFALFPWMSVAENIRVVLRAAHVPEPEVRKRAAKVISLVGLEGFEGASPRELSGVMKQRVGIARALSMEPEVLFMDEPFSHVDALTAESLRAELLDIWASLDKNPSSILLVSHDTKEVAYMADRIVVLSAQPGTVRAVVKNSLPRPRDYRSREFQKLVDYLHEIIAGHEMPDMPEAPAGVAAAIPMPEPLPRASPGEIVGLLEYLDARGGSENVFRLAADTNRQYGRVITVAKAAEMLDLVDTPKQAVVLTPEGRRFVKAPPQERQDLWRGAILKLRLFHEAYEGLRASPEKALRSQDIMETIVLRMPYENPDRIFDTFVQWSRYGNLFHYQEKEGVFSLIEAQEQDAPAA